MKVGFIGTGNMGGALVKAAAAAIDPKEVLIFNRGAEKAKALAAASGVTVASKEEICASCGLIFLGVKPQNMGELLNDLRPFLAARKEGFALVTMAAGITCDTLREMAGGPYPVIRIMPNLPVSVGEGMTLYCADGVEEGYVDAFLEVMRCSGLLCRLAESSIDAGSSVSGCGPAFVCMFVEALADGGVRCGLRRAEAQQMAEQMLLGTARYLLETGSVPEALKDAVCSPGGTTIEGVTALEDGGFRAAVIDAVTRATEKSRAMGKK